MTYHLIVGDRTYSSWSLRGWLLFEKFGIARKSTVLNFMDGPIVGQLAGLGVAPARTLPTVILPDGTIISESLAITEELAQRHPDAGILPSDPAMRALARNLAAEMATGFHALRGFCPMNLRLAYTGVEPTDDVLADLRRIETIWTHALEKSGGPWLCGTYSAADVFFAPVAMRIAGYGLSVNEAAQNYVDQHLSEPSFRQWRAMALASGDSPDRYAQDYNRTTWPGPAPLKAIPADSGPSENATCPYSGDPVTDFMEMDGRIFGFCNPFCRDKTVNDPEAWPAFMAIYQS